MGFDQHIWQDWARNLHRWGLDHYVASMLEATGPLTVLGAQAVYIGQPLLKLVFAGEYLDALTELLEDDQQQRAFVSLLKEVPSSELGQSD
jgi:hypothetical protein